MAGTIAKDVNGQWVYSDKLIPGMKIITADQQVFTIEESWYTREETATIYILKVNKTHTYFVGENKLWAHNNGVCDKKILDRFKRPESLRTTGGHPVEGHYDGTITGKDLGLSHNRPIGKYTLLENTNKLIFRDVEKSLTKKELETALEHIAKEYKGSGVEVSILITKRGHHQGLSIGQYIKIGDSFKKSSGINYYIQEIGDANNANNLIRFWIN